ncbi:MAG: FtsB family cell division protein [Bacillota bacterium]
MMASREMQRLMKSAAAHRPQQARVRRKLTRFCTYAIMGYMAFSFLSRALKIRDLVMEQEAVRQQIAFYEEHLVQLSQKLREAESDEFIEREARERLGLVKPGEIQYVIKQVP